MSLSAPKLRKARRKTKLWRFEAGQLTPKSDHLATEEPLEIRLVARGGTRQTVAVTMRTPGHDFELAAGFLLAEGILDSPEQIRRMAYCTDPGEAQQYNIVNVELKTSTLPDLSPLERHFYTTSACGVCGKAGLDNLQKRCSRVESALRFSTATLTSLPAKLRQQQALFESTGGLHAAALFSSSGELVALREDVGRHNALDKLLGWAFAGGSLPLSGYGVLLSGRASYELVQKCLVAGVPLVASISAPSSLAVELAQTFNLTLVGFLRESFNVYSVPERIVPEGQP